MTKKKKILQKKIDIEEVKNKLYEQSLIEPEVDIKNFVRDNFFEKGHLLLKIRQLVLNLIFFVILVLPVMILFNSLANGENWSFVHYWTYKDGFDLTKYLSSAILLAIVLVLVLSLAFLFRNNYQEQHVYPRKKTYDEGILKKRKAVLNELYTERFGDKSFRETTKYYEVDADQNIDDYLIQILFKNSEVEIK
ncbi:hypothetical protein [Enterococcus faecium]|uniref:hypothetical protein n=1 Tax=Enterococcus faecium TaxID=1352 RepID=UPI0009BDF97D|nr:hypothetical protein [Enterococcus faecium]OQO64490.1 hypothetical protein BH743_12105 [Enterococcus faecium]